jgi:UDP-N-acetylmuramoylalanine--D-glutamate ligase
VLELSSYQIDLTQSLDCDVAVLLNITPDHLDRYENFEGYAASKARLFEMQYFDNPAIIVTEDDQTKEISHSLSRADRRHYQIRSYDITDQDLALSPALSGPHNLQNAAAAQAVCLALQLTDDAIEAGLRTYPGLPHRMERIREKDGVLFVNDSKATNPTATAPALAAFERIRWICGGQPKTDNLNECAPHFGNVRCAYTIGEAANLFETLLKPHIPVKNCGKLDIAVRQAAQDSKAGDTVLLSPACSSFDQFRDFEDRGDQFRSQVRGL